MKFYGKKDLIIASITVLVGILLWVYYRHAFSEVDAKAEIYYNSELVKTIDLDTGVDTEFTVPQDENVVFHLYKDGSIAFEQSDCPDKICIKTGKLSMVGESAACLPNKLFLKIVPKNGNNPDEMDIIVGR